MEILERIKGLEDKLDTLSSEGAFPSSAALHAQLLATTLSPVAIPSAPPTLNTGTHLHGTSFQLHDTSSTSASSGPDDHYKYVSSVHHMLSWPAVQQLFAAAQPKIPTIDLAAVERERPTGMLRLHSPPNYTLPTSSSLLPTRPGSGVSVHGQTTGALPIAISGLTWDTMQRLSKAYFNSFHLLSPILDRHSFLSNIMPSVFNEGFSQDMASTLAFLVFALGEVALAGSDGIPIYAQNGRPSGVKGGARDQPPGLDFFNEARRRMGFNLTECSLENVQIFALAG